MEQPQNGFSQKLCSAFQTKPGSGKVIEDKLGFEMDYMVEASGLRAETKGKWNVGGRTLPVIACYVHNLNTSVP